jgi:hypothetical protein
MWCVNAGDLDLTGREFKKFFEVAVADRWNEAVGCEVDREFRFFENACDREIV